jgi:F0F1-type ATP synthase assembly protein I
MNKLTAKTGLLVAGMTGTLSAQAAVDSYRFAHVTISTPWYIFIFLLMGVFAPFVLMVILAWRNAARKNAPDIGDADGNPS